MVSEDKRGSGTPGGSFRTKQTQYMFEMRLSKRELFVFFADLTSFVFADDVEFCDILPPISLSGKTSQQKRRRLRKHKATISSNSSRFVQISNRDKTRQQRSM